jgi:hypothetical protein
MTRTIVLFALLAVFILLLGSLLVNSLFLVTRIATVEEAVGKVEMRKPNATTWQPVRKGMLIQTGSNLRTSAKSHAVLRWADGSRIKLQSGCQVLYHKWRVNNLTRSSHATFQQFVGRAIFRIKRALRGRQKFEVRTPTVLAAVRGTTFDVDVESRDLTTISVLDGAVDISGRGFQDTVLAGHQSTATREGATSAAISGERQALWAAEQGFIGPRVVVDHPDEGLSTDRPILTIAGAVEPPAEALVNDQPVRTEPDGRFMTRIELQEGENKIVVTGREKESVTSVTRTVTYMPASGAISISLSQGENPDQAIVTAAVADSKGQPVPDGTPVHFEASSGKIGPEARANDGRAAVTLEATQAGEIRITCRSGRASAQITTTVQGPQPQQPQPPAQPGPSPEPSAPSQPGGAAPTPSQPAPQPAPSSP